MNRQNIKSFILYFFAAFLIYNAYKYTISNTTIFHRPVEIYDLRLENGNYVSGKIKNNSASNQKLPGIFDGSGNMQAYMTFYRNKTPVGDMVIRFPKLSVGEELVFSTNVASNNYSWDCYDSNDHDHYQTIKCENIRGDSVQLMELRDTVDLIWYIKPENNIIVTSSTPLPPPSSTIPGPSEIQYQGFPQQDLSAETQNHPEPKVDYTAYMSEVRRKIKRNWQPPNSNQSYSISAVLVIDKQGRLVQSHISKSSGIKSIDDTAILAIVRAAPYQKLPPGSDDTLRMSYNFEYQVESGSAVNAVGSPGFSNDLQSGEEYHVVVASRQDINEAEQIAENLRQKYPSEIYPTPNGWYAVTIGHYPREKAQQVRESAIAEGDIGPDTWIGTGKKKGQEWGYRVFP